MMKKCDVIKKYTVGEKDSLCLTLKVRDMLKLKGKTDKAFLLSSIYSKVDINLDEVFKMHNESGNLVTIICTNKTVEIPYEILEIGNYNEIKFMQTNPRFTFTVSTGTYIISPEFMDYLEDKEDSDLDSVIKYCLRKNEKIGVVMVPSSSFKDLRDIRVFSD